MCKSCIQKKAESGEMLYMVQAKRPSSAERLAEIVQNTWSEISEDTLEKLLQRMPLLCKAVIALDGGYFACWYDVIEHNLFIQYCKNVNTPN